MEKQTSLLSHADYGRSRKARGLSGGTQQAVSKAVREGRINAFGPGKLIDPELADAQWARNSRARVSTQAGGPGAEAAISDRPRLDGLAAAAGSGDSEGMDEAGQRLHADPSYLRSRASQAEAEARISQLKAAELEGVLVRVDLVRTQLAAQLSPVREGLLQLPGRLAPELAALSDAARIQTLLEAEIHKLLATLQRGGEG